MMQPPSTTGLARFRSAPATWLDALLESVTDEDEAFLPPTPLPPRSQAVFETSSGGGIFRQNSLPVDFVASGSDSYFDGYEVVAGGGGVGGVGLNYDFAPSPSSTSSSKRLREQGFLGDSDKFSSQLKEEDRSEHLERGLSGILDPEMEKIFEDSVPCRVRAKRGCATHPRSIAERVRRTRISDRIRKLQELVPNMEKQTNTADMLEEAVEYVKFLQKQIQELTEQQKNCKCVEKEQ